MSDRKSTVNLAIDPASPEMTRLREIATQFGYTRRYGGEVPDVSALMRAIARGELIVVRPAPAEKEGHNDA
jgi:hypothetical protein